jgi:hypothetical protein
MYGLSARLNPESSGPSFAAPPVINYLIIIPAWVILIENAGWMHFN